MSAKPSRPTAQGQAPCQGADGPRLPRVAVVGHTNVGKTSLLRTLLRDAGFGKVSRAPGTTRHVELARLLVDGEPVLELCDTPGLEEPMELWEHLQAEGAGGRLELADRIDRFLEDPAAVARWEQEAKVLRALRHCQAGLVVIDVRDRVLARHRDELQLLAACAVPLLPVFNFVRSAESREAEWRAVLARAGLHAMVRFDTVAPERDAEARLYAALATLVEPLRPRLDRLLAGREAERQARREGAAMLIAEALLEAAAARRRLAPEEDFQPALTQLADDVRRLEGRTIDALLRLYRFEEGALDAPPLPLRGARWKHDLFSAEALGEAGLSVGKGAAAGAVAGLGIDLAVGGISLGAAALLGALVGGSAQAVRTLGGRVADLFRGYRTLSVEDAVLAVLARRLLWLAAALEGRGHAAEAPLGLAVGGAQDEAMLPFAEVLKKARVHPGWSSLSRPRGDAGQRAAAARQLAALVRARLKAAGAAP